jgi:tetratricopeptide (TPR) repeat protein
MRIPILFRALLTAALSTLLVAQEPAVDAKKLRQEANAAVQAGDFTAAAASFKKLTEIDPKDGPAWHMLGYSLHAANKLDEALAVHMKAAEFPAVAAVATYNVACVYALKGKPDEAFAWLDKAIAAGFADVDQLTGDSDFDSVRKDPRMAKAEAAIRAKAKGGPGAAQVLAQNVERRNARAVWFSRQGSPGQLSIDYSPVPWSDKYEEAVASGEQKGKKWRFGADFWTRLDTSLDLQFGSVAVPAGYYYLTLEQRDADTYVLALHDAAAVKKLKLDAFLSERLKGGIEVTMQHKKADEIARELAIAIAMKPGSKTEGTVTVHFGGHALTAPFTAKFE